MADALSITAGVVELLIRAKEITRRLQISGDSSGREDLWILEELSVYENVFRETAEIMLKSLPSIPSSAEGCLRMCNESMRELEALIQPKGKKHKGPEIEKHAQPFLRSVVLFRNIVMDNIIRKLVTDQQDKLMSILGAQKQQEEVMALIACRLDENHKKDEPDIDQLVAKLHATIHNNSSSWIPTESDPFSFTATILSPEQKRLEPTVCRGLLDSGCEDNWISSDTIIRGGLLDRVNSLNETGDTSYRGFGGDSFAPEGIITLTWYASNSATSKNTVFLVHPSAPFDMILGRRWIKEESIFVFDKPALALRQGKFSKGELLEIEKKTREKGVQDNQVNAIRRVADASVREEIRRQKALSRSISRTSTGSSTPNARFLAEGDISGSGSQSGQTYRPPRPEPIAQSSSSSSES